VTLYIVDMAVPVLGEDAHTRLVSEPVEFADLLEVFLDGCREQVRRGHGGTTPYWHVRAVEDDGTERDLTAVEKAALAAQFEQWRGGLRVEFTRPDDDDSAGLPGGYRECRIGGRKPASLKGRSPQNGETGVATHPTGISPRPTPGFAPSAGSSRRAAAPTEGIARCRPATRTRGASRRRCGAR
jgi:hypothetical protein